MRLKGKSIGGKREEKRGFWEIQMKSMLLSIVTIMVVLGAEALLIAGAIIPENWVDGCVLIAALIAVIVGVVTAGISGWKGGGLYGVSYAAAVVLLCAVSGFLLYGAVDWGWCGIMGAICAAGGGAAGTVGAGNRKRRR